MKRKSNTRFPMARIKRIMQTDDEVGKISNGTTVLISSCVEQFVKHLCEETLKITTEKKAKAMTASHLKECIEQEELFDFLTDVVEDIAEGAPSKKKRQNQVAQRKKKSWKLVRRKVTVVPSKAMKRNTEKTNSQGQNNNAEGIFDLLIPQLKTIFQELTGKFH